MQVDNAQHLHNKKGGHALLFFICINFASHQPSRTLLHITNAPPQGTVGYAQTSMLFISGLVISFIITLKKKRAAYTCVQAAH